MSNKWKQKQNSILKNKEAEIVENANFFFFFSYKKAVEAGNFQSTFNTINSSFFLPFPFLHFFFLRFN